MSAWLEIETEKIELFNNFTIGRVKGNSLMLEHKKVSRRHALIHCQGGEFWIVDQGSMNGTFVNQQRVSHPCKLADGDELRLGDHILSFRQDAGFGSENPGETTTPADRTQPATAHSVKLWMLVCDIEGFTGMSHRLPESELAQLVGTWMSDCRAIIEPNKAQPTAGRFQGSINKYLGDGFLAYWPDPATPPSVIDNAVASLWQLRARTKLNFRTVVHHGLVTVAPSITDGAEELVGKELNLLFRLEKAAGAARCYCAVSAAAAAQLEGLGQCESLGTHGLKGFEEEQALFNYIPSGGTTPESPTVTEIKRK